jgi:long-chain acyl-CoA synthetase
LASISVPISTAYETLGEDGLRHSIQEPDCSGIFTNSELLPTLVKVLRKTDGETKIRYIIYDGTHVHDSNIPGVKMMHLDDLLSLGLSHDRTSELDSRRPRAEDLSCIMYTSGSTGSPKGVKITHANMVASVGAVDVLLGHHLPPSHRTSPQDRYLAYLPLAHVLEYIVELSMLFCGVTIGTSFPVIHCLCTSHEDNQDMDLLVP